MRIMIYTQDAGAQSIERRRLLEEVKQKGSGFP